MNVIREAAAAISTACFVHASMAGLVWRKGTQYLLDDRSSFILPPSVWLPLLQRTSSFEIRITKAIVGWK